MLRLDRAAARPWRSRAPMRRPRPLARPLPFDCRSAPGQSEPPVNCARSTFERSSSSAMSSFHAMPLGTSRIAPGYPACPLAKLGWQRKAKSTGVVRPQPAEMNEAADLAIRRLFVFLGIVSLAARHGPVYFACRRQGRSPLVICNHVEAGCLVLLSRFYCCA